MKIRWRDGILVQNHSSCVPETDSLKLAHRIMEMPPDYDGSPESMLRTLGSSLWVRQFDKWYQDNPGYGTFDQAIAGALASVVEACNVLDRPIKKLPAILTTHDTYIYQVLYKAVELDCPFMNDQDQFLAVAQWLRYGMLEAARRYPDGLQVYKTFTVLRSKLDDLINSYQSGKIPKHRCFKLNVRTHRSDVVFS